MATHRAPEMARAGHRRLKVADPPPPQAIPVPDFAELLGPEWGAVATEEWARVVPVLERMGSAHAVDVFLLREYCVCFARLVQIETLITEEGLVVPGQREGAFIKNPVCTLGNAYRASSKAICQQLGIGANSRGTMSLTPPKRSAAIAPGENWLPPRKEKAK